MESGWKSDVITWGQTCHQNISKIAALEHKKLNTRN